RYSLWLPKEERHGFGLAVIIDDGWGLFLVGLLGFSCWRMLVRFWRSGWKLRWSRPLLFLFGWLAIEWVGYLNMTPFPAARRVLGILIITSLLLARLAARTCRGPAARSALWLAAGAGLALGMLYAAIDLADSGLEPEAIREAAAYIRERDPRGRVWYIGHWGTQYEASRHGFVPLTAGRLRLRPGDWVIEPSQWVEQQAYRGDQPLGEPVHI